MEPNEFQPSEKTKELWRIELELSDILLDVCKKNNLHIWAGYGTLIGAARHKGFIPWDDDLDFVMMRPDYDRLLSFIRSSKLSLPNNCEFDIADISVIKLRRIDTTMYLPSYRLSKELSHGVWIDVFCLDTAPENIAMEENRYKSLKTKIRLYHNYKLNYYANSRKLSYFVGHFVLKFAFIFRQIDSFRESIENQLRSDRLRYNNEKVWCFIFWCTVKKDVRKIAIHDAYNFEETIFLPFEDRLFPCPKEYDKLLTAQYGNWHTPVMNGSQHGGVHVEINKPYKEYVEECLNKMPWWKRYWYKH